MSVRNPWARQTSGTSVQTDAFSTASATTPKSTMPSVNIKLLETMGISKLVGWCEECETYEDWVPGNGRIEIMRCPGDHEPRYGKAIYNKTTR